MEESASELRITSRRHFGKIKYKKDTEAPIKLETLSSVSPKFLVSRIIISPNEYSLFNPSMDLKEQALQHPGS